MAEEEGNLMTLKMKVKMTNHQTVIKSELIILNKVKCIWPYCSLHPCMYQTCVFSDLKLVLVV